jgi:hypothetical protein
MIRGAIVRFFSSIIDVHEGAFMSNLDRWISARLAVPFVAGGLFILTGCPGETPQPSKPVTTSTGHADHDDDHDHDHDHGHHHHHAEKGPHGGALVAIGEDDAHLEFVLDSDAGKLTAYVLDGAAEKPVAIKQANLQLAWNLLPPDEEDGTKSDLPDSVSLMMLEAVSPASNGTATEFAAQSDDLKGAEKFEAVLTTINIAGRPFKEISFKYPEGNEDEHHHH